jgi:hypothetical protein
MSESAISYRKYNHYAAQDFLVRALKISLDRMIIISTPDPLDIKQ